MHLFLNLIHVLLRPSHSNSRPNPDLRCPKFTRTLATQVRRDSNSQANVSMITVSVHALDKRFKLVTLYKYNAPVRHYLNVRKFPSFTFVSIPAVKYILGCNIVCWMHGKFVATECRRQFLLRLCFVCSAGAFLPPIHIDISTSMAVVTNLTFYGYSLTGLESLHYFCINRGYSITLSF